MPPCSNLIRTCDKAGKLEVALRLLAEMHAAGVEGLEETYGLLINRLGAQREWDRCIDIFLSLQMVGVEVTHEVFSFFLLYSRHQMDSTAAE
jgi:pentatricopeptide repeat protein